MASPGRVQAPELNLRPSLNPAPVVNVQSVAPVNKQGAGSNLLQIAESLSGLSSSFQRFAASKQNYEADTAKEKKKQNDLWIDRRKYWGSGEILADPTMPNAPEVEVLVGQRKAGEVGGVLWQYTLDEYDPAVHGDYRTWLKNKVDTIQQGMSPAEAAGFGSAVASEFDATVKKFTDLTVDRNKTYLEGNTFNHLLSIGETHKGLPPNERALKMKTEGLDQYRLLMFANGKEQNELLLKVIKYYADNGQTDMVEALSHMPRGANGEVPSLYDNPDYREAIDLAKATGNKKWIELNNAVKIDFNDKQAEIVKSGDMAALQKLYDTHEYSKRLPDDTRSTEFNTARDALKANIIKETSKAQVRSQEIMLAGQVALNFENGVSGQSYDDKTIITSDGKEVVIKGKDVAQEATDALIAKKYEAAGEDPNLIAATDATIARKAAYTPQKITAWEKTNDTALTQINAFALEQGQMTPNIDRAYKLWLNTRDNREVYLAKGGNNAEKLDTLFSAAQVLVEGGQSPEAALAAVARTDPNTKRVNDRMADATRINPALETERNQLPVKVAAAADAETRILIANNVDPLTAYKKVNEKYAERVVQIDIGGTFPSKITYPAGMTDPTEREKFKQGVTNILIHNREAAPSQDRPIDPDTLSVVDNGDGTYSITEDGLPVPTFLRHRGGDSDQQGVNRFTLEDVDRELQYIDAEEAVKTKKEQVDPITGSQESAFVSEGRKIVDGVTSMFSSDGKEEPKPQPKQDESILKGLTDTPENAYGAMTGNDLRKLSDTRLRTIMELDKQGKLETRGFVNSKTIKEEYGVRLRKAAKALGYDASKLPTLENVAFQSGFKDVLQMAQAVEARKKYPDGEKVFSFKQITQAMTRWSTDDPEEAIKLLKKNNVKPTN